jgi:hypothetical protein
MRSPSLQKLQNEGSCPSLCPESTLRGLPGLGGREPRAKDHVARPRAALLSLHADMSRSVHFPSVCWVGMCLGVWGIYGM